MINLYNSTDKQKLALKDGDRIVSHGSTGTFRSMKTYTTPSGKVEIVSFVIDWDSDCPGRW